MKYDSKASKKVRKNKLDPMRASLQTLVSRANELVNELRSQGLTEVNPAIKEAYDTATANVRRRFDYAEDDEYVELFSVSDKKRYRELRKEAARIDAFLSSAQSKTKIASYEQQSLEALENYNLSFHRQKENMQRTGFRFGTTDEESVKFALSIFRKVKEMAEPALFEGGSERFNSDTLFNLIYDSIEGYDPDMPDDTVDLLEKRAIENAQNAINEQRLYNLGFMKGSPRMNKDIGVLEKFKKSETAEQFLKKNKWARNW